MKITQKALADIAGLSEQTIRDYSSELAAMLKEDALERRAP